MSKSKIHILIVEDDLVDRMACRRALTQDPDFEFDLAEAETGQEGVQFTQTKKPDCVLLDYHLPDMNGLEFLAALKNELGEITVPVMMLTGADNASLAVEAMKCGAKDYLVKDANRQYLALLPTVIQRVLRERHSMIEKKQIELRLVQAEAQYRFLVEQIPAITYTASLDIPGKLLYVSPQLGVLGFSPEAWISQVGALLSYIHPDDRAMRAAAFGKACASGNPMRCEYRLLNQVGEIRWFRDEASMVYDKSGAPLLLQGILIDITKDKLVEEELRQHRRHLEKMVNLRTTQFKQQADVLNSANVNLADKLSDSMQTVSELKRRVDQRDDLYQNAPCAYYSLDSEGVFVHINDTALQWLDRTREEVVGELYFTELLSEACAATFMENYQRVKDGGQIRDLKIEIIRKDGSNLSLLLYANAFKDANDRFMMSRSVMLETPDGMGVEQSVI
ncbi:MAG: response regulator [Gallionella sp.]